jgi:hypothetical protein
MNNSNNGIPINVDVSINSKSAMIAGAIIGFAILLGVGVALIVRKHS